MSDEKTVSIYTDFLSKSYATLDKQGKKKMLADIKPQLVASFKADIDKKLQRLVEIPGDIFIETKWTFFPYFKEAIEAYVNGLYVATIALSGACCERICSEILEYVEFRMSGKTVDLSSTKSLVSALTQVERANLLAGGKIFSKSTLRKFLEINKIRNKYVHPSKRNTANIDAKRCMVLLRELVKQKFDLRNFYDFVNGQLVIKKQFRKTK